MSGEEIERAIEFLLKSQATLEGQVAGLAEQVGETNRVIGEINRVIGEMNHIIREQAVSQSELNQAMTKAITDLAEVQRRTETKVDRLADIATQSHLRQDETD